MTVPAVTFGMIVLNGEPFLRYNLRALYPFAHEIIVVEGAAPGSASIATPDGHSTDDTLTNLRAFQAKEDPDNKLVIVTAEDQGYPDGFWPGEKHEQSQAYADRATGDYLWQVDVDEFYRPEDVQTIFQMLQEEPEITALSFKQIQFWGGLSSFVDGWFLRRSLDQIHRIFRWGDAHSYVTHRPPTVRDAKGRDVRSIRWIDAYDLERRGIYLYHYSLVFPKQVLEKCTYYGTASWADRPRAQEWAREAFLELKHPYRVHNVYELPGWLEPFEGEHPPAIHELWRDIENGTLAIEVRQTDDIERLLRSRRYQVGKRLLKALEPADRLLLRVPGYYSIRRGLAFILRALRMGSSFA